MAKVNRQTLDHMPSIYLKRCERDGYEWDTVWLNEDELELDKGEAGPMEQGLSTCEALLK